MRHARSISTVFAGTVVALVLLSAARPSPAAKPKRRAHAPAPRAAKADFESLRLAVADLAETFQARYPRGHQYLDRLRALEAAAGSGDPSAGAKLRRLKHEALLDNPLLDFDKLLVLQRKRGQLGLPVNHKCNAGIAQTGYDNEIAVLGPVRPGGQLRTLFRPKGGEYVGEIDLDFDAGRCFQPANGRSRADRAGASRGQSRGAGEAGGRNRLRHRDLWHGPCSAAGREIFGTTGLKTALDANRQMPYPPRLASHDRVAWS